MEYPRILHEIDTEIARLIQVRNVLANGTVKVAPGQMPAKTPIRTPIQLVKRTISEATRAKMAKARKAHWAAQRKQKTA